MKAKLDFCVSGETIKVNLFPLKPWASLPMAAPPRQKLSQVESSIESGKFLKLSSQVLDIRVHLNSTFGVEYFK